jgi:hypothetical protein
VGSLGNLMFAGFAQRQLVDHTVIVYRAWIPEEVRPIAIHMIRRSKKECWRGYWLRIGGHSFSWKFSSTTRQGVPGGRTWSVLRNSISES